MFIVHYQTSVSVLKTKLSWKRKEIGKLGDIRLYSSEISLNWSNTVQFFFSGHNLSYTFLILDGSIVYVSHHKVQV